ncbi:hypothetical protein HY546_02120 [archaeon]|nr:hypothetical protein [archaeon]
MRTTVHFGGMMELILEKAVEFGLARSKTDALRLGIFSMNREYGLVKDVEIMLLEKRASMIDDDVKKKKLKWLTEEEALAKYR